MPLPLIDAITWIDAISWIYAITFIDIIPWIDAISWIDAIFLTHYVRITNSDIFVITFVLTDFNFPVPLHITVAYRKIHEFPLDYFPLDLLDNFPFELIDRRNRFIFGSLCPNVPQTKEPLHFQR